MKESDLHNIIGTLFTVIFAVGLNFSVVNFVLDIMLTDLWRWGVAGAAWATIIGQAVSFLF